MANRVSPISVTIPEEEPPDDDKTPVRVKAPLLVKVTYVLDTILAKRRSQFFGVVLVLTVLIFIGGTLNFLVDSHDDMWDSIWDAWTFMADPGTHSDAQGPARRIVSMAITFSGIFIFAVLLGFIVDSIREKMDNLKKGRSLVVESDHTLILGWTDKSIAFIKEIALANESEKGGTIVVLAPIDKEILEADFIEQVKTSELLGTRVVFRSGSPLHSADLVKVSTSNAKSIVVFAEGTDAERSDANVLRVVMALKSLREPLTGHVVVEVRDIDNEPLVRLMGGDVVETLVSHDIIGRLMLMSVRQPGLAKVYDTVLGFDGDEFYMRVWPELAGTPFRECYKRFPAAVPIGLRTLSGQLHICPDFDMCISEHDEIIVIAEDDDTYSLEPAVTVQVPTKLSRQLPIAVPEKVLFCGWRRDVRDMLLLLDSLVARGSEVHMLSDLALDLRGRSLLDSGLDVRMLRNFTIEHHIGNSASRRCLETLPILHFTSALILADVSMEEDMMHSDSHCLATLLLLRDIQKTKILGAGSGPAPVLKDRVQLNTPKGKISMSTLTPFSSPIGEDGKNMCPIVCEILDPRTQKTISGNSSVMSSSDFVQSNLLVSRILAMVSENRSVKVILDTLLGQAGPSLEIRDAECYVKHGTVCNFFALTAIAQQFSELLIGYCEKDPTALPVVNPKDKDVDRAWGNYNMIVLVDEKRSLSRQDPSTPAQSSATLEQSKKPQGLTSAGVIMQEIQKRIANISSQSTPTNDALRSEAADLAWSLYQTLDTNSDSTSHLRSVPDGSSPHLSAKPSYSSRDKSEFDGAQSKVGASSATYSAAAAAAATTIAANPATPRTADIPAAVATNVATAPVVSTPAHSSAAQAAVNSGRHAAASSAAFHGTGSRRNSGELRTPPAYGAVTKKESVNSANNVRKTNPMRHGALHVHDYEAPPPPPCPPPDDAGLDW